MAIGLIKLAQEDPSFYFSCDEEINQTVIEGMGELHLEIIVDRLKRYFKVYFFCLLFMLHFLTYFVRWTIMLHKKSFFFSKHIFFQTQVRIIDYGRL